MVHVWFPANNTEENLMDFSNQGTEDFPDLVGSVNHGFQLLDEAAGYSGPLNNGFELMENPIETNQIEPSQTGYVNRGFELMESQIGPLEIGNLRENEPLEIGNLIETGSNFNLRENELLANQTEEDSPILLERKFSLLNLDERKQTMDPFEKEFSFLDIYEKREPKVTFAKEVSVLVENKDSKIAMSVPLLDYEEDHGLGKLSKSFSKDLNLVENNLKENTFQKENRIPFSPKNALNGKSESFFPMVMEASKKHKEDYWQRTYLEPPRVDPKITVGFADISKPKKKIGKKIAKGTGTVLNFLFSSLNML